MLQLLESIVSVLSCKSLDESSSLVLQMEMTLLFALICAASALKGVFTFKRVSWYVHKREKLVPKNICRHGGTRSPACKGVNESSRWVVAAELSDAGKNFCCWQIRWMNLKVKSRKNHNECSVPKVKILSVDKFIRGLYGGVVVSTALCLRDFVWVLSSARPHRWFYIVPCCEHVCSCVALQHSGDLSRMPSIHLHHSDRVVGAAV